MTNATNLISTEFYELIVTANFDWQVSQYAYYMGNLHKHSANEIKAAAIREIAVAQHGEAFDKAVAAY